MIRLLTFLVLNFGALYIGALLMGGSPAENEWYQSLDKAPWTPPGWMFGVAWTIIMVCFSIYMSELSVRYSGKKLQLLLLLYGVQWALNVSWNLIFFNFHLSLFGLIILLFLIFILLVIHFNFANAQRVFILTLLPYLIWLSIAVSMNFYILIRN